MADWQVFCARGVLQPGECQSVVGQREDATPARRDQHWISEVQLVEMANRNPQCEEDATEFEYIDVAKRSSGIQALGIVMALCGKSGPTKIIQREAPHMWEFSGPVVERGVGRSKEHGLDREEQEGQLGNTIEDHAHCLTGKWLGEEVHAGLGDA